MSQRIYSAMLRLQSASFAPSPVIRIGARATMLLLRRPWHRFQSRRLLVRARLYGRSLLLRSDHLLPLHLAHCPSFGEPLTLLIQAIQRTPVRVIDVGANIGSTVAMIEQACPGRCTFLCVEPDPEYAELLRQNLRDRSDVVIEQCFISDEEGAALTTVHHSPGTAATVSDPGRAGAATIPSRTLDAIAAPFVERHGGLDVLKVDTDGYDFKVLRSAAGLIRRHAPTLFFELHPCLWDAAGEDPRAVFAFLSDFGYRCFVFFSNLGEIHARYTNPDPREIQALVDLARARREGDDFHYDVLAAEESLCETVVGMSLERTRQRSEARRRRVGGRAP